MGKSERQIQISVRAGQAIGTENLDNLICAVVRIPNRAYHRFDAHDSEVNAVRWSPHGNLVATAAIHYLGLRLLTMVSKSDCLIQLIRLEVNE